MASVPSSFEYWWTSSTSMTTVQHQCLNKWLFSSNDAVSKRMLTAPNFQSPKAECQAALRQPAARLAQLPVTDAWWDAIGPGATSPDGTLKPHSDRNVRNRFFWKLHWMSRRGGGSDAWAARLCRQSFEAHKQCRHIWTGSGFEQLSSASCNAGQGSSGRMIFRGSFCFF